MELFRGESRIQLGKKLIGLVHARAHPVMLLQGGPGVGKTTVVNYGKEALRQSGEFFVYPKSIEISVNSTRETIAAEYLAAMTTAAMAQSPERNWEQDPRWKEAYETISEVWKTGGLGVSGSFAGFGVGVTLTQVQKVAEVMPWETWKALLENVLEALLEQRRGFLLHLNNIDAVSDENPEKAQELFDAIRDLLTVDGIHTILCASSSFLDEVLADRQRVLDVVELVDTVPELPPEEFLDAVHARYDYFHDPESELVYPIADEALGEIYNVFGGDMRNTFKVASSAVVEGSSTSAGTESLSLNDLMVLKAADFERAYTALPDSEREIVDYLLEHGTSSSQTEIREDIGGSPSTVSVASNRLEHRRWISTEKVGRRRTYELSGYGTLLKRVRDAGLV